MKFLGVVMLVDLAFIVGALFGAWLAYSRGILAERKRTIIKLDDLRSRFHDPEIATATRKAGEHVLVRM